MLLCQVKRCVFRGGGRQSMQQQGCAELNTRLSCLCPQEHQQAGSAATPVLPNMRQRCSTTRSMQNRTAEPWVCVSSANKCPCIHLGVVQPAKRQRCLAPSVTASSTYCTECADSRIRSRVRWWFDVSVVALLQGALSRMARSSWTGLLHIVYVVCCWLPLFVLC